MPYPKNFCLTIFNYDNDFFEKISQIKDLQYIILGEEIAPSTGNPHLQGYIQFSKPKRIDTARKLMQKIYPGCCITQAKGTDEENYVYCSKDGKFQEYGERKTVVQQGGRTDLTSIATRIMDEGEKVDDIIQMHPGQNAQYLRYMDRCESIALRKVYRDFMTKGFWLHGATGVGKTKIVYDTFEREDIYTHIDDKGWWDSYRGQKVVLIDDFRGGIPYNLLLKLCDRYPFSVPQRCRAPMPFTSKYIIITSSLPIDEVYHNLAQNDSIDQLMRRFTEIHFVLGTVIEF